MIKYIKITNLYGRNYNIDFNQDLTLLVGKNGSGKTTILNLINLIVTGQLTKICEYKFDYLELAFYKKKSLFIVTKIEDAYTISYNNKVVHLEEKKEKVFFVTDYSSLDEEILNQNNRRAISHGDSLKMLSVDDQSNRNLNGIKNEFKSSYEFVYVPLNRKVSWNSNNVPMRKNHNDEVDDSVKIAEKYLINYRHFIKHIEQKKNEATKEKMIDIFSEPIEFDIDNFYLNKEIEEFRSQYKQEFDEKIVYTIDKLFIQYEKRKEEYLEISNQKGKFDANKYINYNLSIIQLFKLNEILNYIKEEFDWLQKMKSNFNLILHNINDLFSDTGKNIYFDEDMSCLFFKNNKDTKILEVNHLSSGEKQLLMFYIFCMATFTNKKHSSSIVLFDEPELSLHIEWQEKLLESIQNKSFQKQIIIATHSPDIIGEFANKCFEVKGI